MINIDFLTNLSHECARAMLAYDSTNEDAIDFYLSISEIIRVISAIIEKEINGNKGMLFDFDTFFDAIDSLATFDNFDFSSLRALRAYLEN